jgi:26S proteasome regulatory subunit N8
VQPKEVGLPVHAYVAREEVKPAGTEKAQRVFQHLPTSVRHTEVEEIGVEHLLKDVKDATISTLSTEVAGKAQVLRRSCTLVPGTGVILLCQCTSSVPCNC